MGLLFRLPLLLFEYLLRRLFGGGQDTYAPAAPSTRSTTAPVAEPFVGETGAPPPTADEVLDRRVAREATASAGSVTPLRPIAESRNGHLDTEPEVVESFGPADDVGGTITVEEPWDGYASQPVSAIITRLRGADAATKAVVALYERGHKNRKTVLKATA
ncbi:hypothetical protein [Baekduia sp. Peel2402]|uniref:hypothetical protein n=1 Tax=Baekduia sp. Peel2402 TaxID=3458296 RepID=UPI00403EDEA7